MTITLHVKRQKSATSKSYFEDFIVSDVSEDMSFLEMLDILNEKLILEGKDTIAFDHDCREGICGTCGMVLNGKPHGPLEHTTVCQLHMRKYRDGDEIYVEPYSAVAFPIVKDLIVDRVALDKIIQAGGYVSVNTGVTTDSNAVPIPKGNADSAMDAAECIGCGACVAACPNGSAMLFTSAKISHFSLLPQGKVERKSRVQAMIAQMDKEGFGACSNHYECEAVCPKGVSIRFISHTNRELMKSLFTSKEYKK